MSTSHTYGDSYLLWCCIDDAIHGFGHDHLELWKVSLPLGTLDSKAEYSLRLKLRSKGPL